MTKAFWWLSRAQGLGLLTLLCIAVLAFLDAEAAFAHAVAQGDKGYIQEISGAHVLPFVYLGAKHMVTGYDHILFLLGVVFFLYRHQQLHHRRHHWSIGGLQGA